MAKFFYNMIIMGNITTIDDVPQAFREQVKALLEKEN